MSKRKKLRKIKEAMTLANVFQSDATLPDTWTTFFAHPGHITLELGCGAGAYTIALSVLFPKRSFIGVDIKGARIWNGAKKALELGQKNVAFLRGGIERIGTNFHPGSIEEIWVTFPDPFPRKKQAKHRLTSPRFLALYQTLLKKGGTVNLKTDDEALFDYSVDTAEACGWTVEKSIKNLYAEEVTNPVLSIQTVYEVKHRAVGKKIFYARFSYSI